MSSKTMLTATRFVDLVLAQEDWGKTKSLPAEQVQALFDVVSAAGFKPAEIVPGKLVGNILDDDACPTGKTYPINELCPFKVKDEEGKDRYTPTGWLDCALRRVAFGFSRQQEERYRLIEVIAVEIERSIPLEPIQFTRDGDLLVEDPPDTQSLAALPYFVDHTRDTDDLSGCVGIHEFCRGYVERHCATRTHDALVCRQCHLRALFPKEIKTYGELRQALAAQWALKSA